MTFVQTSAPSTRLRPFKPTPFGRYTLLMPLATGGMGEVYLAKLEGAQGFEKLCVIKKILPHLAEDAEFVSRFINEAKTLVKLSHGSIAQVLDMGQHDGEPYLSLEFIDGKDLRKIAARVKERGLPLPVTFLLFVMGKVLDALAYAHRKRDDDEKEIGLVHRDVSPQNVLISYEGDVKVIDFGLAKSTLNVSKTNPSIVLGKFLYMSPEQARHGKVDRRSDLYSAGLCLYELVAGKNPFDDVPPGELMAKVANPQIPPVQHAEPLCPPNVAQIIDKALSIDPAKRFQTAEEMRGKVMQALLDIDPGAGPENVSRFMRDVFATEYQSERKLLTQLREQARASSPVQPMPVRREVEAQVAPLHELRRPQPFAEERTPLPSEVRKLNVAAGLEPAALSFAPTPRLTVQIDNDVPEKEEAETSPGVFVDHDALEVRPGGARVAASTASPSSVDAREAGEGFRPGGARVPAWTASPSSPAPSSITAAALPPVPTDRNLSAVPHTTQPYLKPVREVLRAAEEEAEVHHPEDQSTSPYVATVPDEAYPPESIPPTVTGSLLESTPGYKLKQGLVGEHTEPVDARGFGGRPMLPPPPRRHTEGSAGPWAPETTTPVARPLEPTPSRGGLALEPTSPPVPDSELPVGSQSTTLPPGQISPFVSGSAAVVSDTPPMLQPVAPSAPRRPSAPIPPVKATPMPAAAHPGLSDEAPNIIVSPAAAKPITQPPTRAKASLTTPLPRALENRAPPLENTGNTSPTRIQPKPVWIVLVLLLVFGIGVVVVASIFKDREEEGGVFDAFGNDSGDKRRRELPKASGKYRQAEEEPELPMLPARGTPSEETAAPEPEGAGEAAPTEAPAAEAVAPAEAAPAAAPPPQVEAPPADPAAEDDLQPLNQKAKPAAKPAKRRPGSK